LISFHPERPCFASRSLPPFISHRSNRGAWRGAKMPSFHIGSVCGRAAVSRIPHGPWPLRKRLHIETPVNTTLTRILLQLTDGSLPLDTYAHQPEKLLAAIPR